MGNPRLVHLITGKHILKYQEGTLDYGLLLGADCGIGLVGYLDSDWAGSVTNRKSTSGCCFSLGSCDCVAQSEVDEDGVPYYSGRACL